jgi:mono/diheme cytochrome c family protein
MRDREHEAELKPIAGAVGLAGAGAAVLILGLAFIATPRPADALPAYAKQTGLSCGSCHVNAAGGGPRNAFGKAFAANGHKLPAKSKAAKGGGGAAAPEPSVVAPTIVLDRAQAQAWSLRKPYYTHFLYNSCDYGC